MRDVLETANRVASTQAKVLITGESGVGKDVLARYIHGHSPRAHQPFVALNCAAVSDTLLESELFGHVRGSFTDAHRDKAGKLQLANHGTIFLDEVGEMSIRMQALLLRFLENGEIQQVGSDSVASLVDVRLIAATNRNLKHMVAEGQFREDLMFRINVVHIHIPPLRERPDDIPILVEHLLAADGGRCQITPAAIAILQRYAWPGNVRELQNVIEQIVTFTDGKAIDVDNLPASVVTAATGHLTRVHERRRQVSDELFEALASGRYSFWDQVHRLFASHDITRHDLRQLVRRGLAETEGSYRALLKLFGINHSDYKRFLNFLATHDCSVDFREFRPERATRPTVTEGRGASPGWTPPHLSARRPRRR